jgi:pilus assembly protein CpaF
MTDELIQRIASLESQVALLSRIVVAQDGRGPESAEPTDLGDALANALTALAPLQPLLQDDTVNDVLINGPDKIYVERAGKLERVDITFPSDSAVFAVAQTIAAQVGRHIDTRRPLLDARLPDGSRVNVIAPPLSVDGTAISIRKFAKRSITLDMMRDQGNVSGGLADFLKVIAKCKLNILISGGTGSGKTTVHRRG